MRSVGRLAGMICAVTGAASGIGRAIATRFVAEGATVAVIDIDGEQEAAAELGGGAFSLRADVSDEASVQAALAAVVARAGRLDVLCNNAGIVGEIVPLADCTVENFDRVIAINLRGVFLGIKHAVPYMLAQGRGAIINISSGGGFVAVPGEGPYCSSKGGVLQLTRVAAVEYSARGVRVNAICPGAVETPLAQRVFASNPEIYQAAIAQHPIGRLGRPEEIAACAAFLASEDASFVTGAALSVDGGYLAI